jgi:hypothetical protein
MESHGFMRAAHKATVPAIVVKGISDAGDAEKARLEKETGGFFRVYSCSNAMVAVLEMANRKPRPPIDATQRLVPSSRRVASSPTLTGVVSGTSIVRADVPPPPDIFLGRTEDLSRLLEMLGNAGASADSCPVTISAIHGFTGIGKTALAAKFAAEYASAAGFVDGVLWATATKKRRFLTIASRWGRTLEYPKLVSAASTEEGIGNLRAALADRRILVVLDDLWSLELMSLVRRAIGRGSALLMTTRLPGLVIEAGLPSSRIHHLPPLDRASSLQLLETLCPGVTIDRAAVCDRLLTKLECLPIALHVAGRLLRLEQDAGLDTGRVLNEIDAALVVSNSAPLDRADPDTGAVPSVAALLELSVHSLSAVERARFAQLAVFGEGATFDLEALARFWGIEDARPTLRGLHRRGLIESAGGRYRIHSLLLALASRVLDRDS